MKCNFNYDGSVIVIDIPENITLDLALIVIVEGFKKLGIEIE